jgi:hypothetical protein
MQPQSVRSQPQQQPIQHQAAPPPPQQQPAQHQPQQPPAQQPPAQQPARPQQQDFSARVYDEDDIEIPTFMRKRR